jgi:hypothetical protein
LFAACAIDSVTLIFVYVAMSTEHRSGCEVSKPIIDVFLELRGDVDVRQCNHGLLALCLLFACSLLALCLLFACALLGMDGGVCSSAVMLTFRFSIYYALKGN